MQRSRTKRLAVSARGVSYNSLQTAPPSKLPPSTAPCELCRDRIFTKEYYSLFISLSWRDHLSTRGSVSSLPHSVAPSAREPARV